MNEHTKDPRDERRPEPPYDPDAEEAVIGSLLIDHDALPRVQAVGLSHHDFYLERLGLVYRAIEGLHQAGKPITRLLVADQLRQRGCLEQAGGAGALLDLVARCTTTIYAGDHAEIVRRCSMQRSYIGTAGKIAEVAYSHAGSPLELRDILAGIWASGNSNGHGPATTTLYSLSDILDTFGDPGPDIVQGFIPGEAVVLFSGDGGVGKGYTLLDLAFRVSQGLPWLDLPTCKTTVLIVDLENRGPWLRRRVLELMGGHGLEHPPENVHIALAFHNRLDGPGFVPELVGLAQQSQAGLVILDSLADFLGDLDENSNPHMARAAAQLRSVRDATGATILSQHHVSKASSGKTYQTSRGASSLYDGVDVDIQVRRDGSQLVMAHRKNRLGEETTLTARLNWGPGTFNVSPVRVSKGRTARAGQGDPDEAAILAVLQDGEWHDSGELVGAVVQERGRKRNTIHDKLRLMRQDGVLESGEIVRGKSYQLRLSSGHNGDGQGPGK